MARDCICGKHMLQAANEGTCLSCGHGDIIVATVAKLRPRRRVSRDLGALNREGRTPRADGSCAYVARTLEPVAA